MATRQASTSTTGSKETKTVQTADRIQAVTDADGAGRNEPSQSSSPLSNLRLVWACVVLWPLVLHFGLVERVVGAIASFWGYLKEEFMSDFVLAAAMVTIGVSVTTIWALWNRKR